MPDGGEPTRPRSRTAVLLYRALGVVCVALGTLGVFLPLLPTTVFLLIAVWAFARGSPEWADKLRAHPRLGPYIRDWEERRAIPRRAKALAVVLMATSWTGVAIATRSLIWMIGLGATLAVVAAWIVTRPSS